MSVEIGQTISHYQILDKLGEGGMGLVYKALDTSLNRNVALKFLPTHLTEDPESRKRFIVEAQSASALDHPNICTIHEINETEKGQLYICMNYYQGESLRQKIKKGPVPFREAIKIIMQIARGLQAAHNQKIIHRDIKPGNILISENGEVKIVDFGLAKLAGQKLTESVSTKGTIAYMAPEFIRGIPADNRTDIWSLGVVLFEMLTGHLPFEGEYPEPMMYSIINEEPELLSQYLNDVPEILESILDKCLNKDPVQRYQNLGELISDLEKLKPGMNETGSTVITKKSNRKPSYKITIIGFFLIILIIGFILIYQYISNTPATGAKHIAVITFENHTGEKKFDYLQKAIPNLLISSLEQSGNLRVATWEHLNDLLKQKNMQNVDMIDPDLGFELCRMDGIETIILGSYTKAGDIFALDIKMLDVVTKELLQSAHTHGNGISSILTHQIDELSTNITKNLGVPPKISGSIRPLSEITTTSMEAYNYFIRGRDEWEKRNIENSKHFLEKAVKIDTTFATAYSYLAIAYYMLDEPKTCKSMLQKARHHSARATEKERLYIEARFALYIEKNNEKRFNLLHNITARYPQEKRAHLDLAFFYYFRRKLYTQAFERFQIVLELDPNFGLAYNMLALTYMETGEYQKAIQNFEQYASLNPGDANVFDSMGELYLRMGELDQALAKYQEAIEVEPQYFYAYRSTSYIYALKEDYENTIKWIDQYIKMAASEGIKARGHLYKGFYYFWLGSIRQSLKELVVAANYYGVIESGRGLAHIEWIKGWIYFYRGERIKGRQHFKNWYDYWLEEDPEFASLYRAEYCFYSGTTDLSEAKVDSAREKLDEMKTLLPHIEPQNRDRIQHYYNILSMELLLSDGYIEKVISIYEKISTLPIPSIYPKSLIYYNLPFINSRELSAIANLRRGNLDEAINAYEKLINLNHQKSKERRLVHPTYYFKLAKLYEQKGQFNKASERYRKFLEIWKNADAGTPEVIEAQKSLHRMSGMN
ncbi:MAG: protein kinase [Calditrichaeota bacterium]|nr:protein kinase [Calditrichota bacterium]